MEPIDPNGFANQTQSSNKYYTPPSHEGVWNTLRSSTALGRGTILITGEPGSGKTLLIHRLVEVLPDNRQGVLIHHPDGNSRRFLRQLICAVQPAPLEEEGDETPQNNDEPTTEKLFKALEARAAHPRNVLVAVDDAHRLTIDNLRSLALLVNSKGEDEQPVQLLLVGRSDLMELVNSPPFEDFAKSITGTAILSPLNRVEQHAFVVQLVEQLSRRQVTMTWFSWLRLTFHSHGNPGRITTMIRKALILANEQASENEPLVIDGAIIRAAVSAIDGPPAHPLTRRLPWIAAGSTIALIAIVTFLAGKSMAPTQEKLVVVARSSVLPEPPSSGALTPPNTATSEENIGETLRPSLIVPPTTSARKEPSTASTVNVASAPASAPAMANTTSSTSLSATSTQSTTAGKRDGTLAALPPIAPIDPASIKEAKSDLKLDSKLNTKPENRPAAAKQEIKAPPPVKPEHRPSQEAKSAPKPPAVAPPPPTSKVPFVVQAGAYGTRDFALDVMNRLKGLGLQPFIREVESKGRLFYAIRINTPDEASATKLAAQLHDREKLPVLILPPPKP